MGRSLRSRALRVATVGSVVLLLVTLSLVVLGFFITPRDHHLSVTDRFHLGVWGSRLVVFSSDSGPYCGSIIAIVDEDGNEYPPRIRESMWGDRLGIYWRYFRWKDGTWGMSDPVLWTLMVSLWYPILLFAVLPAVWGYRRRREEVMNHE